MPQMPWGKVLGAGIALTLLWGISFLPEQWERLAVGVGAWLGALVTDAILDERDRRDRDRRRALARLRTLDVLLRRRRV